MAAPEEKQPKSEKGVASSASASQSQAAPSSSSGGIVGTKYHLPSWVAPVPITTLTLEVQKGTAIIESVPLGKKICYLFGRQEDLVDVSLLHPSVSREHAVIVHGSPPSLALPTTEMEDGEAPPPRGGATLIDLNSSWGTFVSKTADKPGRKLDPKQNYVLCEGDVIRFGDSTRRYIVKGLPPEVKSASAPSTSAPTSSGPRKKVSKINKGGNKKSKNEVPQDGGGDGGGGGGGGLPRPDRTSQMYGAFFTKAAEKLETTDESEGGGGKRKKPPTQHWQETSFDDASRKDKFLKLMGAKKGTTDTGYGKKEKR